MGGGTPAERVTVGIVGAGTMGTGIAQACLLAGHEVLIHDADQAAQGRVRERIRGRLDKQVQKGGVSSDAAASMLASLREAPDLEVLATEVDLVIEAAIEDLAVKRAIFRHLDLQALPDVPLATNTSSLSIASIAEAAHHRERVLGMHFFNPAPVMALVEVVAGDDTAASIVDMVMRFAVGLGKTPVLCADLPGFIVNRVNRGFTLEPLRMLEAGESTVVAIDAAVEAAGYPMGPFRLMDLTGVDVGLAVTRSLFDAFGDAPRFRPSPIQEAMVAAGTLGQKSGRGFYRYTPEGAVVAEDGSSQDGRDAPSIDPAAILDRVELAIVNEAYRAVGERVADAPDIDLAMRLGAGHPRGPCERAGQLGLRTLVARLRDLQASTTALSGDQYEVAPALWQIATV